MLFNRNLTNLLSWAAATYGVIIYSLAFAFEMWFIVTYNDENDAIPVIAFILAAIYFIIVVSSLVLILALIINSILCLSIWLIVMVLIFLPECGLVLYMSIYKWGIDSLNGQIELCFYIARGIFDVIFVVCVQSLLSHWKNEKEISTYAMNLCSYTSPPSLSPYHESASTSTTINPVFKYTSSLTRGLPISEFDPKNLHIHEYLKHSESPIVTYSTQSLDRKAKKITHTNSFRDEVILRPLRHRPFEYLNRPGSVVDLRFDPQRHRYFPAHEFPERNSSTQSIRDVAL